MTLKTLPDNFEPSQSHFDKATELGLDLLDEIEGFKLHHLAKGTKHERWDLALHLWLRNAIKFRRVYANNKTTIANDREQRAVDVYSGEFRF